MRTLPALDPAQATTSSGSARRLRGACAVLAGAALLLAGSAVPAQAAPDVQPGRYTGSGDNDASLRVTSNGKVADFTITVFPSCVDEAGVGVEWDRQIPIADDGTFEGTARNEIVADGGQRVTAVSTVEGEVRPDGIAEGRFEWTLEGYDCLDVAYFWLRNEDAPGGEPPKPSGPVTVRAGSYTDGSGGTMRVSSDRRVTSLARSYPYFCGLRYAGQRAGSFTSPVRVATDGSFTATVTDSAGGRETLRGQFHHDGSMWGTIDYVNRNSGCAGSTGFTFTLPGGGGGGGGASGPTFYLNNGWGPNADHEFVYGRRGDQVLIGDWDGNGTDSITLRRGNRFYLSNSPRGGAAEREFTYGRPGDTILVGDWDGDGKDTLAVRRGNQYFVKNSLTEGNADRVIHYGRASDKIVVGDWDGDGKDTFAVRRGARYYVKNAIEGGNADREFTYGRPADITLAGDWDGDGKDTFAVRRGNRYFVKNTISAGNADLERTYGRAGDDVYVGDWDGDRKDTLGVRRTP